MRLEALLQRPHVFRVDEQAIVRKLRIVPRPATGLLRQPDDQSATADLGERLLLHHPLGPEDFHKEADGLLDVSYRNAHMVEARGHGLPRWLLRLACGRTRHGFFPPGLESCDQRVAGSIR